jgi:hypothetical protein
MFLPLNPLTDVSAVRVLDETYPALLQGLTIKMAAHDTAGKTIFFGNKVFPEGTERFVQSLSSLG